jgi:hypothetical protein
VSEPCVFVLWETARSQEKRIVDDLGRRFALCQVIEITWPPHSFARNLTRVYGEALPSGSDKERECGTGPFLVVVAADPSPRYRLRRTSRGVRRVNARAAAAKRRYRRWTAGGFRVHGSLDRAEAERDLQLLLRQSGAEAIGSRWDGRVRRIAANDDDWSDAAQLLAAIASATPATLEHEDATTVRLRAEDVWWAAVIAGGDPPDDDAEEADLTISIGGGPRSLRIEKLAA